jgi:phosphoribosylformimino-5-aminoimidazole carboxamide ribotide isomerase
MEIIPAIDIINGSCVRLKKGDYDDVTKYSDDPLFVARQFEDAGFRRLHLVDLDGARARQIVNIDILKKIASQTGLIIDFGGGVRSNDDIRNAFEAGAHMITGGSIAVAHPTSFQNWLTEFGPDKIVLGADVKGRNIAIKGWTETSEWDILDFIQYYKEKNVKYIICTDVERDGILMGPAFDLYLEIINNFPDMRIISSGGVSSIKDVDRLQKIGVWGVIIGRAIYEGIIKIEDLRKFI